MHGGWVTRVPASFDRATRLSPLKMRMPGQAILPRGDHWATVSYDKLGTGISNICSHAKIQYPIRELQNRNDPCPITWSNVALPELAITYSDPFFYDKNT